jgi:hypothetical protein
LNGGAGRGTTEKLRTTEVTESLRKIGISPIGADLIPEKSSVFQWFPVLQWFNCRNFGFNFGIRDQSNGVGTANGTEMIRLLIANGWRGAIKPGSNQTTLMWFLPRMDADFQDLVLEILPSHLNAKRRQIVAGTTCSSPWWGQSVPTFRVAAPIQVSALPHPAQRGF